MIERQVIVTWEDPKKPPKPGEIVVMTISGKGKNMEYDHAFALGCWYDDGLGWDLESVQLDEFIVHAWADLEPYGMLAAKALKGMKA